MRKHNTMTLNPIAKSLAMAIALSSFSANAQQEDQVDQTDENAEEAVEIIEVVYGIRDSLQNALNKKRNSDRVVDAISAEDIGQLPDQNIGEALSRLPGIMLEREAGGEGGTITLRGLAVQSITMNGAQMATGTGNGMSGGNSRDTNFQDLASSLIESIEVYKTPQADQTQAAIAGTVELKTKRASSIDRMIVNARAQGRYNESTEKTDPNFGVTLANGWDVNDDGGRFGIIAGLNWEERRTASFNMHTKSFRLFNINRDADADSSRPNARLPIHDFNGDGDLNSLDAFIYSGGLGARYEYNEYTRVGAQLGLGYRVNNNLKFDLDINHFSRDNDKFRNEARIVANDRSKVALVNDEAPVLQTLNVARNDGSFVPVPILGAAEISQIGALRFGTSGGGLNGEHNQFTGTETTNVNFDVVYNKGDQKFEFKLARSMTSIEFNRAEARYGLDNAVRDRLTYTYDMTDGFSDLTINNLNPDGATSIINVNDSASIPGLRLDLLRLHTADTENTNDTVRFDYTRYVEWGAISRIKTGIEYFSQTNERSNLVNHRVLEGGQQARGIDDPAVAGCTSSQNFNNLLDDNHVFSNWITYSCGFDESVAAFGVSPDIFDPFDDVSVEREQYNAYVMLNLDQDVAGMNLTGNIGLRYTDVEGTSTGVTRTPIINDDGSIQRGEPSDEGDLGRVQFETSELATYTTGFDYLLPSINLNLKVTDDMRLRLGAAKAVRAPNLGDMRPNVAFDQPGSQELFGVPYESRRGNPGLKPEESQTIDLSWEWYFAKGALLAVAPYWKSWDSVNDFQIVEDTYGNETVSTRVPITIDNIGSDGDINGIEFSYQQPFTFLPGFWSNFGINANYTTQEANPSSNRLDIEGLPRPLTSHTRLPETLWNVQLWYDDGKFSARLAANYKSEQEVFHVNVDGLGRFRTGPGAQAPAIGLGGGETQFTSNAMRMILDESTYVDFSMNYKFDNNIRLTFQALNITGQRNETYATFPNIRRGVAESGKKYNLILNYAF